MLDADNPAGPTDSNTGDTTPESAVSAGTAPESLAPAEAETTAPARKAPAKRAAAKKTAAKKAPAKRTAKKAAAADTPLDLPAADAPVETPVDTPAEGADPASAARKVAAKRTTTKKATSTTAKKATAKRTARPATVDPAADTAGPADQGAAQGADQGADQGDAGSTSTGAPPATALLFQPPDASKAVPARKRAAKKTAAPKADEPAPEEGAEEGAEPSVEGEAPKARPARKTAQKTAQKTPRKTAATAGPGEDDASVAEAQETGQETAEETAEGEVASEGADEQGGERRRRRRGGRRRRRSGGGDGDGQGATDQDGPREDDEGDREQGDGAGRSGGGQRDQQGGDDSDDSGSASTRRRRRRRRSGEGGEAADDETTVTRNRRPRNAEDEITSLSGSTRLEAKKQRRREGREAGRRRAPIVSEAEFLARRESVDRVMVIRQRKDLTQIAVLEDKVLVEHYVARESQTSLIGNVYLGRVQNVLPSMEAAFIDIGKGRNAVLYAGEVNWDALGAKNGTPRKIEAVLKSGQSILVQVTKDPIGHKGARLTSQVSLPGRFLVYVPDGTTSGISRKLPDTERNRLKTLLKDIVPESAGVIVRTAAEGASEEELTRDVERLTARWADIESKVDGGNAPQLLYGEPDLTLKVVRDLFTEDFGRLVISGDDAWDTVEGYVTHVAPDLADRLERYDGDRDVFAEHRIDEQIEKALDRKVWLPSGGSLVIDRTEAMTVVDVNTGKFTGSGGNLEETVTKNNLEAAEEIVRQLRLRDIGGIIVVDFIDMVLESNRDLVLRRMVECLGRDRTRHQVAEVTSLGLVQMTRKRIGTGLLEAFSESCEHCQGRGLVLHHEPVEPRKKVDDDSRRGSGGRRGGGGGGGGRGRGRDGDSGSGTTGNGAGSVPSPKDIAALPRHDDAPPHHADRIEDVDGEQPAPVAESVGRGDDRAEAATDAAPDVPTAAAPETETVAATAAATEVETAPVAPAAPRIVTSTRRRSARRPAGPPAGSTAAVVTASAPPTPAADTGGTAPEGASTDGTAAEVPALEQADGVAAAGVSQAAEDDSSTGTPHVPVKKKGSRRR